MHLLSTLSNMFLRLPFLCLAISVLPPPCLPSPILYLLLSLPFLFFLSSSSSLPSLFHFFLSKMIGIDACGWRQRIWWSKLAVMDLEGCLSQDRLWGPIVVSRRWLRFPLLCLSPPSLFFQTPLPCCLRISFHFAVFFSGNSILGHAPPRLDPYRLFSPRSTSSWLNG